MIESIGKSWGAHIAQMVVSIDAIVHYSLVIGVQEVCAVVSEGTHGVRFTFFSAGKLKKVRKENLGYLYFVTCILLGRFPLVGKIKKYYLNGIENVSYVGPSEKNP